MSDAERPGAAAHGRFSGIQVAASVVGVVIVAFIVLLATRDAQQNGPNDAIVGQPVPAFAGVSYDGSRFDVEEVLAANRTRPAGEQEWVVVNFFASWCVPCEIEHPELVRFDEEGVACPSRLVGVTIRDSEEGVSEFFARRGGEWPVLVGETNPIIIDFGVTAPPETLVVAPSGVVVEKLIGAVTYDDLARAIRCG